jgi:hypothetical protein
MAVAAPECGSTICGWNSSPISVNVKFRQVAKRSSPARSPYVRL